MDKNEQLIMVVKRDLLFLEDYFHGFKPNTVNFESRILKNYEYMKRGLAEDDPNYKQPIAYNIIINPEIEKVFVYQRSPDDKRYGEKRLQGKWSFGIGGHIEKIDSKNPIKESMLREINEEIRIPIGFNERILGYINDDTNSVGKVHFGILYIVETDAKEIIPKDKEIKEGKFRSLEEIAKIIGSEDYNLEKWSEISFRPLKEFFLRRY